MSRVVRVCLFLVGLLFATTANAEEVRRAWAGGSMRDVPREVEGPAAWVPTATITDYGYDRRLKGWLPVDLVTWPVQPAIGDRSYAVGARVEVLRMRCFVDERRRRRVRCEDGRTPPPVLLAEPFGAERSDVLPPLLTQCYDVHVVGPTPAEIRKATSILSRGRTLTEVPFLKGDRFVHIVVYRTHWERETIRLKNKKREVDVHERVEAVLIDHAPRVKSAKVGLTRIVPLAAGEVEPAFEALVLRRQWFPGREAYVARRLEHVDVRGLPPTERAVVEYDRVVEHLAVGNTARAAAALSRLESGLDGVSSDVRAMIDSQLPRIRAIARGERLLYHPCTGRPW